MNNKNLLLMSVVSLLVLTQVIMPRGGHGGGYGYGRYGGWGGRGWYGGFGLGLGLGYGASPYYYSPYYNDPYYYDRYYRRYPYYPSHLGNLFGLLPW